MKADIKTDKIYFETRLPHCLSGFTVQQGSSKMVVVEKGV